MKKLIVNTGKVALLYSRGEYKRCLEAGSYWIMPWRKVMTYDMASQFIAPIELNILLQDAYLSSLLDIVRVNDNEIVLVYKEGNLETVLRAGKYAYWEGLVDRKFVFADISKIDITEGIDLKSVKKAELMPFIRACKVESYENGILYLDNKFDRVLTPGEYYFWKNAIEVKIEKVDLRQKQIESLGQEILTKDKASVRVNFYLSYKVVDIKKALIDNKDFEKQLYVNMQMVLRAYLGKYTLDELLQNKSNVSNYVQETLRKEVAELGIELKDSGIKDVILPGEMREIMSKVLLAEKKAQANIIMRREETASTRSLLNTAKLMEDNKMLFKLKEMEYIERVADKINTISVSNSGQLVDQLATIFSAGK